MSLKLHPRYLKVAEASAEIKLAILKLEEKHDLTVAEMVRVLLESAMDFNKSQIQHDRYPNDPDKKGDEA